VVGWEPGAFFDVTLLILAAMIRYHRSSMKTFSNQAIKYIFLIGAILFLTTLVAGCSGGALTAASWPGLSIEGTMAYVAYNRQVYAIDLDSQDELWRFPDPPDRRTFFAPPAVSEEGPIIVGGYDNQVYALNKVNGAEVWSEPFDLPTDRIVGSPVVTGDMVLIPSADGKLYALELLTGKPVWPEPFQAQEALWSAPLVDGERVLFTSLDHYVYALDLSSGRELWRSDELGSAIIDTPTLIDDVLLVSTFSGKVFALESLSGEPAWPEPFNATDWLWGTPAAADGVLYFGDVSGVINAVNLNAGSTEWSDKLGQAVVASPVILDEKVYFVTRPGVVYAYETGSGKSLWTTDLKLEGELLTDPLITDETIVLAAMDPECLIYGVDIDSGAFKCIFQPEE